ncbi:MAG: hypothetical protein ACXVJD_04730 [Mucilaginibacter sp.]
MIFSYTCTPIISVFLAITTWYNTSAVTPLQQPQALSYMKEIGGHDLAPLWRNTRLHYPESYQQWGPFPEPLGFIGTNYQRFYIHYTSIIKDPKNSYRYNVKGKTRVRNHICRFTGVITVLKARLFSATNAEYPQYREGDVACSVELWEDSSQPGSGHIAGKLITRWFLDKKNNIQYNTLDASSDGFDNNQCTAAWTAYHGGITKTCNWGDFRIPDSGNLDVGAGEFHVNEKYQSSGWQNYNRITAENKQDKSVKPAKAEEQRKWWQ